MRDLWLKIAYTSGAQAYSLVVGTLLLLLTARWLGPEGRGIVVAATTWAMAFGAFGHLSLGQAAIHRATRLRGTAWLGPTLATLASAAGAATLLGWLVALTVFGATGGTGFGPVPPPALAVAFLSLPFLVWEQYGTSLLIAIDRLTTYNRAQVLGRTVALALVAAAWMAGLGAVGVLWAMVVSQAVIALTGVRSLLGRAEPPVRPQLDVLRELASGGLRLHLNYFGDFFFSAAGVLIVNYYRGVAETGLYQLGLQLVTIVLFVPAAASMVTLSKIAQLGPQDAWPIQRRLLAVLLPLMSAGAVVAGLAAGRIIPLLLGPAFEPSVELFRVLLWQVPAVTIIRCVGGQWLGRGLLATSSSLTMTAGLANVAACLVLVPRFGALGAAWSLLGAYALATVAQSGMAIWCEIELRRGHPGKSA